jgi:hypothetical protein
VGSTSSGVAPVLLAFLVFGTEISSRVLHLGYDLERRVTVVYGLFLVACNLLAIVVVMILNIVLNGVSIHMAIVIFFLSM